MLRRRYLVKGSKSMHNNFRKTYMTWILILVLPRVLVHLGVASGHIALSEDLVALLTVVTKSGAIFLIIWYGLKVGIKNVWAWVLGFATLLPFKFWISVAILLTQKTGHSNLENTPR